MLLVSTNKCPTNILMPISNSESRIHAQGGLQHNEQEDAEVEENKKVQISACPYLILISCHDAMYRTDYVEDE